MQIKSFHRMNMLEIIKEASNGLWNGLLDMIFPSNIYCISCGKPIDDRLPYSLCGTCVRDIKWANSNNCFKCGKPLNIAPEDGLCNDCRVKNRMFTKGYTCAVYGRMERELIHRFKYQNMPHYCGNLGQLMYERIYSENINLDLVIPVPMYKGKERRRGYNQAYLLARFLSKKLDKPCRTDLLNRILDTKPMSSLGADERSKNINEAFAVTAKGFDYLKDKNILLVDDVFTTGSTVDACTQVLRSAGTSQIYVITFASGVDINIH